MRPGDSLGAAIPGNLTGKRASVATAYLPTPPGYCPGSRPCLTRPPTPAPTGTSRTAPQAWRVAFVRDEGHRIADDKQDDYVRGLAFGLLQPAQRATVATRLAELIGQAGFHLGTGFLSTPCC